MGIQNHTGMLYIIIYMISRFLLDLKLLFLWGVAVLELDSHPDHNKGYGLAPALFQKLTHRS